MVGLLRYLLPASRNEVRQRPGHPTKTIRLIIIIWGRQRVLRMSLMPKDLSFEGGP